MCREQVQPNRPCMHQFVCVCVQVIVNECLCVLCTRFHLCNNTSVLYMSMCVCVCVCIRERKVHDVSAQERLMHVVLHTVLL